MARLGCTSALEIVRGASNAPCVALVRDGDPPPAAAGRTRERVSLLTLFRAALRTYRPPPGPKTHTKG